MIKNKTDITEFENLCSHVKIDCDNQYYFEQDLIDFKLIDIPTNLSLVEKVHTFCTMLNVDMSLIHKDIETEIWPML